MFVVVVVVVMLVKLVGLVGLVELAPQVPQVPQVVALGTETTYLCDRFHVAGWHEDAPNKQQTYIYSEADRGSETQTQAQTRAETQRGKCMILKRE